MKNQDRNHLSHFAKLGLLRQFSSLGFQIGVNWYITPEGICSSDSPASDEEAALAQQCDSQLWETLQAQPNFRHTLLDPALLRYNNFLDCQDTENKDPRARGFWHLEAMDRLFGSNILLLDPDEGLLPLDAAASSSSCVTATELQEYYQTGATVIYTQRLADQPEAFYLEQHQQLLDSGVFVGARSLVLKTAGEDPRLLFFLLQPQHDALIRSEVDTMLQAGWNKILTPCEM